MLSYCNSHFLIYNGRKPDLQSSYQTTGTTNAQMTVTVPLTSNLRPSEYSVPVTSKDMESGKLVVDSNARTDKIFSVKKGIIAKLMGTVDRKTHIATCKPLLSNDAQGGADVGIVYCCAMEYHAI